jgi:hypothetical protein
VAAPDRAPRDSYAPPLPVAPAVSATDPRPSRAAEAERLFEKFPTKQLRDMETVLKPGNGVLPWATSELNLIRAELKQRGEKPAS